MPPPRLVLYRNKYFSICIIFLSFFFTYLCVYFKIISERVYIPLPHAYCQEIENHILMVFYKEVGVYGEAVGDFIINTICNIRMRQ